jgi:hypothetical protein
MPSADDVVEGDDQEDNEAVQAPITSRIISPDDYPDRRALHWRQHRGIPRPEQVSIRSTAKMFGSLSRNVKAYAEEWLSTKQTMDPAYTLMHPSMILYMSRVDLDLVVTTCMAGMSSEAIAILGRPNFEGPDLLELPSLPKGALWQGTYFSILSAGGRDEN